LHQYAQDRNDAFTNEPSSVETTSVSEPFGLRPGVAVKHRRVLLAAASDDVTYALLPVIRTLDAAVVKVDDGAALEHALLKRGPFELVLTDSRLSGGTGLGILAGTHCSGQRTPFIIVQSIREHLVRVLIGGGSGGVLSTRVVSKLALVELAEELVETHAVSSSLLQSSRFATGVSG
jgi:CheY-like chemotaxis protein